MTSRFSDLMEPCTIPLEELQAMTGEERLKIAMGMTDELRWRIADRFRAENPGCAEWEVKLELLRFSFDPEAVPEGVVEWLRKDDGPAWA